LGYILKPVDYVKLEKAVDKAIMKIVLNHHNNDVFHFIKTLENNNDLIDKISIHNNDKVVFINIKEIISVEANNGICEIKLVNNTRYISNKDLKLFDEMLENIGSFIRVNRSVVINAKCIKSYTKGDNFNIEMIDGSEFEVSRRKKTEVLSKLKNI
jgi:two-component system LytT family response regulator